LVFLGFGLVPDMLKIEITANFFLVSIFLMKKEVCWGLCKLYGKAPIGAIQIFAYKKRYSIQAKERYPK